VPALLGNDRQRLSFGGGLSGAQSWRELAAYFPEAKVLHTIRDANEWFNSTQATFAPHGPAKRPGPMSEFFNAFLSAFGDHLHDRAFMTGYFRKHTREVIRTISAQRLPVYQVDQGWDPCANSWRWLCHLSHSPRRIRVPNSSPA
jgi:hypothetical protein